MRIVQLDVGGQRIEFHPYVSVVRGIDDGLRAQLVEAFATLSTGHPSANGLVEAHGVVLDLDDDTLELLDLAGLNGSIDAVVRRDQLPGVAADESVRSRGELERARSDAADRLTRAQADADRARVALLASQEALEDRTTGTADGSRLDATRAELERLSQRSVELDAAAEEARLEQARCEEAQVIAEQRVAHARTLRADAARTCTLAAAALEAARSARDPFAASALDAARERLAELETAGPSGDEGAAGVPVSEFDDPAGEVERLQTRRLELEASLLALDTVDPYPVEVALSRVVSAGGDGELVVSDEAVRMADELARVDESIAHTAPGDTGGNAVATARQRLDAARAALFEAEQAVRRPEVGHDDVEALENAHEQVLRAQDRLDKRFAGGRAMQRLDRGRAQEGEILSRLGFRTYAEFVMGMSTLDVDPESERRLHAARRELVAAEDALAELEAGVDAELERVALVSRRRDLVNAAVALLGRDPGDDVERALRHHRVRVDDSAERARRLAEALENAGMAVGGEDVPTSLLIEMATIWLDELAETASRREVLEKELHEVEDRLGRATEAAALLASMPSAEQAEEASNQRIARYESQLEEARRAVSAAEQRADRQNEIEADIADRKAELEAATRAEEAVAAALTEAEEEATAAADTEHAAAREWARRDAERAAAVDAEHEIREVLERLSTRLDEASADGDNSEFEQAVAAAEAALAHAMAAVDGARLDLERIDRALAGEVVDSPAATPSPDGTAIEELEWYLLSRVASQRAVSYAGSMPLVIDDALDGVHGDDLTHLLSRLERMSAAVQIAVLSENDEIVQWAHSVGRDRAATVSPVPA